MIIKNRLKAILHKKGMNQVELANMLNIKPETLSRTINGNPTLKSLTDIANALEVDVADLFSSSSPKGYVEYNGEVYHITSVDDLKKLLKAIDTLNSKKI